jgi:hypothetical protein
VETPEATNVVHVEEPDMHSWPVVAVSVGELKPNRLAAAVTTEVGPVTPA